MFIKKHHFDGKTITSQSKKWQGKIFVMHKIDEIVHKSRICTTFLWTMSKTSNPIK